jgi:threonine dehydrogenase-like Zn-dependent dehydrogenase
MIGGAATALHWAINSVKKGGIVSIVGVYGPIQTLVPIGNVVNKGITIRANQASVKRLAAAPDRACADGVHRRQGTDYTSHSVGVCVRWIPHLFREAR